LYGHNGEKRKSTKKPTGATGWYLRAARHTPLGRLVLVGFFVDLTPNTPEGAENMGGQAMDAKRLSGGFLVDPNKLVIIGLDTNDGPEHPLFDKRAKLPVDEDLADAMIREGFRGAIEVRKNGKSEDGEDIFEVVFGRRRTRAARRAGEKIKDEFPVAVLVRKLDDEEAFAVRIGENIRRKDLSTLDKADELKRYITRGHNEKEAALVFSMSENGVKNLMKVHDLSADVRKAVENEQLSVAAAAELADLPRDEQNVELKKLLDAAAQGTKATRQAAKKAKKARNGGDGTVAPPKRFVTNILKLNERHNKPLNPDFVKGILWTLGDIQSSSIKGLRELEKEVEEIKSSKKAKKSKAASA
jgi:ParB family transcriptional regulator, chromosome partitioning protein